MLGKNKDEDKQNNKSQVDKIILGAIIGTAVGSAIGAGMAPKKGKDTRKDAKKRLKLIGETSSRLIKLGKRLFPIKNLFSRKKKQVNSGEPLMPFDEMKAIPHEGEKVEDL